MFWKKLNREKRTKKEKKRNEMKYSVRETMRVYVILFLSLRRITTIFSIEELITVHPIHGSQ